MAPHLVITIDAGTGSNRACIYDIASHRSLAVASRDYADRASRPGPRRVAAGPVVASHY